MAINNERYPKTIRINLRISFKIFLNSLILFELKKIKIIWEVNIAKAVGKTELLLSQDRKSRAKLK